MLLIGGALLLDFLLGDPYSFPHPVRFMGAYIRFFEKNIRKICVKKNGYRLAGLLMAVSLILLSYGIVKGLIWAAACVSPVLGQCVEIFFLWTCIALKCLKKECMKIHDSLEKGEIAKARKEISYLVSRDTEALDEKQIIKATVETALENTSDGIIAPLFYMLLGGAPLAMAYKAVNTMDSMVGYKNEKYIDFGFFPAKMDDVVNFIPARLTAFLMLLWAFFTGKEYKKGAAILKRDRKKSKSPNAGWPEAAAAGIMGIQICGPTSYFGKIVEKEFIGEDRKPLTFHFIKESCGYMTGSTALLFVIGGILRLCLGGS